MADVEAELEDELEAALEAEAVEEQEESEIDSSNELEVAKIEIDFLKAELHNLKIENESLFNQINERLIADRKAEIFQEEKAKLEEHEILTSEDKILKFTNRFPLDLNNEDDFRNHVADLMDLNKRKYQVAKKSPINLGDSTQFQKPEPKKSSIPPVNMHYITGQRKRGFFK